eukprot:CAMPEP_0180610888 /NCGR_PEP_ID=MMETSP1037_2-20121125/29511_1 /TAXON_ID=632150 /ORGANISM="Azadinium spinosum, Strain 3D9" /LENGTH=140 /DNA_ID=CAMNT_0022630339 /DNA_START=138 /DNA_END=561 /DNA_ORIENTATION=-
MHRTASTSAQRPARTAWIWVREHRQDVVAATASVPFPARSLRMTRGLFSSHHVDAQLLAELHLLHHLDGIAVNVVDLEDEVAAPYNVVWILNLRIPIRNDSFLRHLGDEDAILGPTMCGAEGYLDAQARLWGSHDFQAEG